jgi:magnesium-transporting ATPase (P-type)
VKINQINSCFVIFFHFQVMNFQPFDPALRRTEAVFLHKGQNTVKKAMKGQLRVLLEFCEQSITAADKDKWQTIANDFASRYRILSLSLSLSHFWL